jgi:threonine dehydratase
MTSTQLNCRTGGELYFKCENFQKVAAFKARGACNAVFLLDDAAKRGVVTHSSGNHGAALAWAAAKRGITAHIVMPANAPLVKKSAVESYGGKVVYCEPTISAREAACAKLVRDLGLELVHPFNDYRIIAGQGTAALELLEEIPDLDIIVTPLGGGGLLAGTAVAAQGMNPHIRVIGAEPAGADDGYRSFRGGAIVQEATANTICDGLRSLLGENSFSLIQKHVDDIALAGEKNIVAAMRMTWEIMKILIESSSATPLGAILEGNLDVRSKRVGIILTGGNVDLDRLPWQ